MLKYYERSLECLKTYIKVINMVPSEKEWNRYANVENLLSSKSLGYYNKKTFNELCKNIYKIERIKK